MLMREYELVIILRPDTSEEDTQKLLDRLDGILQSDGGVLLRRDLWGKRKLAYEIQKHQKGIYYYMRFLCQGDIILEIERNLKMLEFVIRYMTVKIAERVDSETRQEQIKLEIEEEAKRREELANQPEGEESEKPSRSHVDEDEDDGDDDASDDDDEDDDEDDKDKND